jgi:hypothetical protein
MKNCLSKYVKHTQTFEQYGAEEACWAHNPKVGGSKPPTATHFVVTTTQASGACLVVLMSIGGVFDTGNSLFLIRHEPNSHTQPFTF